MRHPAPYREALTVSIMTRVPAPIRRMGSIGAVAVAGALMVPLLATATPAVAADAAAPVNTTTYSYSPGYQSFTVPAGVATVFVAVDGGSGADGEGSGGGGQGAPGGEVMGDLAVTPGEVLTLWVGGAGRGRGRARLRQPGARRLRRRQRRLWLRDGRWRWRRRWRRRRQLPGGQRQDHGGRRRWRRWRRQHHRLRRHNLRRSRRGRQPRRLLPRTRPRLPQHLRDDHCRWRRSQRHRF